MIIFIILLSILSSILFNSFLEWIIHGPLEHGKISILIGQRKSHIDHHNFYSQKEGFSNENHGNSVAIPHWFFVPVTLISWAVASVIAHFLESTIFVWCFVVTTMIHYIFFQYVHTSMHIPKGRWIEQTKWFKNKKSEHVVHHRMDEDFEHPINICVLCSWADRIIGTYFKKK
jgi:hypothetical protein